MTSFTKIQIINFIDARINESNFSTGPNTCSSKYFFWAMMKVLVQNDIATPTMINTILTEKWG